jgi:MMPL family
MVALIAILTFLLLARAFRSLLLPLKAVVLRRRSSPAGRCGRCPAPRPGSRRPDTDVKVFATGLAAGIMLDATMIRALLVPAVVSLFGRWNWWLPARPATRPARWLRVEPSLPPRVATEFAN